MTKISTIIATKVQKQAKDITEIECYTFTKKDYYTNKHLEKNSKN